MSLKVNEIFYSIQGESSYAGYPCVFVRLTGCNLRCTYCDTRYAYDEGRDMAIDEIVERVASYRCGLVEITGGEPLIQKETPRLVSALLEQGYQVLLETNGSQDISCVDERCVKIVDIKCPSSNEHEKNDKENIQRLKEHDEIKFVIGTREDYDYAKTMVERIRRIHVNIQIIHFSPVFGIMTPQQLAARILEDRLNVRFHVQLHKIIWDPEERGV